MNKITKATLVWAGTSIMGIAYTPQPKAIPTKDFIEKTYVKGDRIGNWMASEVRKEELKRNLQRARKAIKLKMETVQLDADTRITGYTAMQKVHVHSARLIKAIIDKKFNQVV